MEREELRKLRVAVLWGGWSDERDISYQSATQCLSALKEAGFSSVELLDLAAEDFMSRITSDGFDVAFVAMHGSYGEDGCVQGLLEILHVPYTFSGVAASAVANEKQLTKAVYEQAGIRAPRGVDLDGTHVLSEEEQDRLVAELGLPLFVKPAANGSSFGITRVTDKGQLADAVRAAGAGGGRVLVEECVEGTEITVPVIGNSEPRALPVVEIVTGADFYDLKVKYEPSALHHVIPARLDEDVYARAQELAVRAHSALGCLGCSRSDFIVTPEGDPVILETNTIPGMTAESLLPDSARHAGIEFPELCTMFVEYALAAHERRS